MAVVKDIAVMNDSGAAMEKLESAPADAEPRWKAAGEPYQLTRDELVDNLRHRFKYDVTARQLRAWQAYGILPKPLRAVPRGATDGKPRALYPHYMFLTILELCERWEAGATRDELKDAAPDLLRKYRQNTAIEMPEEGQKSTGFPRVPRAVQRAVWEYVARVAEPALFDRVILTLETKVGGNIEIAIRPPPPRQKSD